MFRSGALAAGALALAAFAALPVATGVAAAPPPCNNAPQITDASGDGHHPGTDVLAAWWSEAAGRLQAVVQVRAGVWVAEHDDAEINGAGFNLVFATGVRTSFLRVRTPPQDRAQDPVIYDYGAVTPMGEFQVEGTTAGVTEPGAGGTVTIDVPPALAGPGAKLIGFRVITYDGINAGVPTPVDHAPGSVSPNDSARGAEYSVGSCVAAPPGTNAAVTSVQLGAPKTVTGRKTVTVSGKVLPARAGVAVTLTRTANKKAVETRVASAADGSFSARVAIGETTRLRAAAEGVRSSELTVTARAKVKIKVRNHKDGSATVTGTVDPKLPGRIQWLRSNAITPSARTTTRSNGTFRLRLKHPRDGRYQVVFIPSKNRAERATSNTGVIR